MVLAFGHGEPFDVAARTVPFLGRLSPLPEKLRLLHSVLGGLQTALLHLLQLQTALLHLLQLGVVGEVAGGSGHPLIVTIPGLVDNDLPVDEGLEPLGQLVVVLRMEDVIDVEIQLQPMLVQHLLHEVEVVCAVILRNRRGVELHPALLREPKSDHFTKEHSVPQLFELVPALRLHPPYYLLASIAHLLIYRRFD